MGDRRRDLDEFLVLGVYISYSEKTEGRRWDLSLQRDQQSESTLPTRGSLL